MFNLRWINDSTLWNPFVRNSRSSTLYQQQYNIRKKILVTLLFSPSIYLRDHKLNVYIIIFERGMYSHDFVLYTDGFAVIGKTIALHIKDFPYKFSGVHINTKPTKLFFLLACTESLNFVEKLFPVYVNNLSFFFRLSFITIFVVVNERHAKEFPRFSRKEPIQVGWYTEIVIRFVSCFWHIHIYSTRRINALVESSSTREKKIGFGVKMN